MKPVEGLGLNGDIGELFQCSPQTFSAQLYRGIFAIFHPLALLDSFSREERILMHLNPFELYLLAKSLSTRIRYARSTKKD
jgi:hypothetical protein